MKNLLTTFALIVGTFSFAQTYNTGDVELNANLKIVNTDANKNLASFKVELTKTFSTTLPKVNACFTAGMTAGDVYLAFEIGRITKKPIETVITSYKTNKSKGWGVIAKELGIKPGSAEFHQLKGNCKNKSAKGKSSAKPANGNTKGNASKPKGQSSKGNGKPKGK